MAKCYGEGDVREKRFNGGTKRYMSFEKALLNYLPFPADVFAIGLMGLQLIVGLAAFIQYVKTPQDNDYLKKDAETGERTSAVTFAGRTMLEARYARQRSLLWKIQGLLIDESSRTTAEDFVKQLFEIEDTVDGE